MKDFHVRRGAHWIVMSLFLTVAGCGGDSGTNGDNDNGNGNGNGTNPVAQTTVTVSNDFFNPADIQVSPGAMVTWTWAGGHPIGHSVTFTDPAIVSSVTQINGIHVAAMPMATGTYYYNCTTHPSTMQGAVTVSSGGGISYNLR